MTQDDTVYVCDIHSLSKVCRQRNMLLELCSVAANHATANL